MEKQEWLTFALDSIPDCSGCYGIYLPTLEQWFYVGKAQNIAKRLSNIYHPIHLAKSLSLEKGYYYIPATSGLGQLENRLIRDLSPMGNGGTVGSCGLYPDGREVLSFAGWNPQLQCLC